MLDNFNAKEVYKKGFNQAIKEISTFKEFKHIRNGGNYDKILIELQEFLDKRLEKVIAIRYDNDEDKRSLQVK